MNTSDSVTQLHRELQNAGHEGEVVQETDASEVTVYFDTGESLQCFLDIVLAMYDADPKSMYQRSGVRQSEVTPPEPRWRIGLSAEDHSSDRPGSRHERPWIVVEFWVAFPASDLPAILSLLSAYNLANEDTDP